MFEFNEKNWNIDIAEPKYSSVYLDGDKAIFEKNSFAKATIFCEDSQVKGGNTYKFSVSLAMEGVKSVIYPYAILGFVGNDGNYIQRFFVNSTDQSGTKKEIVFTAPQGTEKMIVHLGLKGSGKLTWNIPSLTECQAEIRKKAKLASIYIPTCTTLREALDKIILGVDNAGKMGADLMILSEVIYDFGAGLPIPETAENISEGGTYLNAMKAKAKEYGSYIIANLHEKDDDNHYYNTSVLIGRDGEIIGKYRKTHNSMSEFEKGITPGEEYPVFDTDLGKIGMLICWDAYFPEPARILTQNGADLIAVSTVGDAAFRHVARAMENGVYVIVAGNHFANLNDCGILPCKIINPKGEILSQTNDICGVAMAEVDLKDKELMPYLSIPSTYTIPANIYKNDRRPEHYKQMSEF